MEPTDAQSNPGPGSGPPDRRLPGPSKDPATDSGAGAGKALPTSRTDSSGRQDGDGGGHGQGGGPASGGLPEWTGLGTEAPSWQRTVFWMFVLALMTGSGLYVFKSCRDLPGEALSLTADKAVQVMTNASRTLASLAASFQQRAVTVSMESTGTKLEDVKHLQFRRVTQTEIFTHTDRATTGFGYIALPEVIVEARAPVEYNYYLDLEAAWRLVVRDRVVHVLTPDIQFNRPSVDVSRIEYQVRKGSVFRDTEAARESLKKSITSLAYMKGLENVGLARAGGRDPVRDFVQQWLLRNFSDGTNFEVRVYFPGEKLVDGLDFTPKE